MKEEKRGLKLKTLEILNSKPAIGFLIFIILGLGMVIAGDVVFKEGDLTVDTNVLHVDSVNNRVGIGTTSPQGVLHVYGPDNVAPDSFYFDDDYGSSTFFNRRTQPTGIGQRLGYLIFSANDGNDTDAGAPQIQALTDGAWNDTSHPAYLDFRTVQYNSASTASRLLISSNGNITMDTNTFFVDAKNNRVGIGTIRPTHTLNVIGDINATGTVYYSGGIAATSPIILESLGDPQTIIGIKADNGEWVGCGVYHLSETNSYEWRCAPNSEVSNKVNKIQTRRQARDSCLSQDKVFNEEDLSCN